MLAVSLALLAAVAYGASDFVGGVLSKTRSSWMVATASQLVAAVVTLIAAFFVPGDPALGDFVWAAAGGVGEAVGIASLYYGLAHGRMGVVAPISGTGATLLPVVVGIVTGDEPSVLAWVGVALAFPAAYLIPRAPAPVPSHDDTPTASTSGSVVTGILAGLGFGAQFAFVGQIGGNSGLLPPTLLWVVSAVTVAVVATILRESWLPRRGSRVVPVLAFGPIGGIAVIAFLLATAQGLLTLVAVIAALYPAVTVAMAALFLRERIGRVQALGLLLAVGTVVLVTLGR